MATCSQKLVQLEFAALSYSWVPILTRYSHNFDAESRNIMLEIGLILTAVNIDPIYDAPYILFIDALYLYVSAVSWILNAFKIVLLLLQ